MNGYVTTDFERGMDVGRQVAEAQLKAENATLRTQLADVTESMGRVEERCAKLRELTKDMFACISHANEADWFYFERDKTGCGMSCTVNGEGCGLLVLADRMRELGIEVDGWLS